MPIQTNRDITIKKVMCMCSVLLRNGADVPAMDDGASTLLYIASQNGHRDVFCEMGRMYIMLKMTVLLVVHYL